MHEANIEVLRNEAQRLLELEITLLEEMLRADGVISNATTESKQTFDRESVPKYLEVLRGEHTKLTNMELVIAVVGTMKAGKSTTINAIVGTEVLPNRNRPMTALPTLIRHTLGQVEPILKFENNEPINVLFESIRQHIATGKVNDVLKSLSDDSDMKELIGNITSRKNFAQHYQGADNIFWCLKTLNDLVRLSSTLGVDFPFSSYSNVGQMPVITVEFAHLREAGKTHGQLTLLDTPGPNEAGQEHLRDMLTEQLKKTSAVLAVFDYTQLKSDADEQVRAEIKSIAKLHTGRLFALVNKFDQKDRNGDGKEAVQTLVADTLMSGLLDKKHVFPVSSKWGYLANRARHEVAVHHKLPNAEESSWVIDFAEEAFGRRWESKISDNEEVIKSANALWEDSGFHEPMENVIRAAHTKVALLSIDSAAGKLVECANNIENFLGIRKGALHTSTEALKKHIQDLKTKIAEVGRLETETKENVKSTLGELKKKTDKTVKDAKKNCEETVVKYFKAGKLAEKKANAEQQAKDKQQESGLFGQIRHYYMGGVDGESERDFNPNDKTLKFRNKDDANEQISKMQNSVDEVIEKGKSDSRESVRKELAKFHESFEKNAKDAKRIIFGINETMASNGFKINLKPPSERELNKVFTDSGLSLKNKIETHTKTDYRLVEKSGVGSWIARKLWGGGYEKEYYDVTDYIIDIDEIKQFIVESVDKDFGTYNNVMDVEIIQPLNSEINTFFSELERTIGQVSADLQQGIRDKKDKEGAELNALNECLAQFSSGVPAIKKDSEALSCDVDYLKGVKVVRWPHDF